MNNCEYCTRPHGEAANCEGCGAPVRGGAMPWLYDPTVIDPETLHRAKAGDWIMVDPGAQRGRMTLYDPQVIDPAALQRAEKTGEWMRITGRDVTGIRWDFGAQS